MISWQSQIKLRVSCPLCESKRHIFLFKKKSHFFPLSTNFFKCQSCGFIYSEAALTALGIEAFYAEKYVKSNYTMYSHFGSLKVQHFKERLQEIIEVKKNNNLPAKTKKTLLDLGCGEGISLRAAYELGLEVTGVEVSEKAAALASANQAGQVYCANLDELEKLKLGQFDFVVMFDVLDHVAEPLKLLNSVVKLLKADGTMYIEVCNIESFYAKLMGKFYTHIIPFEHFSYFSPATLKLLVEKCGLVSGEVTHLRRPVTLAFLIATLQEFNPLLGKLLSPLLIFKQLRNRIFFIPVGVMSIALHKSVEKRESHA